jgi:hypothetical protein
MVYKIHLCLDVNFLLEWEPWICLRSFLSTNKLAFENVIAS